MLTTQVLPSFVHRFIMNPVVLMQCRFPQFSRNGLLRHSLSHRLGLPVAWLMGGRLQLCQWSASCLGS
jgi:hypothetical protein